MKRRNLTFPICLLVTFCLALCSTMLSTVRDMPESAVGAIATATAIGPAVQPTQMWVSTRMPALQEKQATQDGLAIVETGSWDLLVIKATGILRLAWRVVGIALALWTVGVTAFGALAVVVALCAYAWERAKRAQSFKPYQVMPYAPFLIPGWRTLIDPSTGRQTDPTKEHAADPAHGQLLIAHKVAAMKPTKEQSQIITEIKGALYAEIARTFVPSFGKRRVYGEVIE